MNGKISGNELKFLKALDSQLQNIPASCPYGLPHQAIYRMARFSVIPEEIMGILLAAGYRRYGNTIYTMGCVGCQSCVPIKLNPFEFSPNRNQRRNAKQNRDITTKSDVVGTNEGQQALLQKFFNIRFPDKNNRAEDYYTGFFLNASGFSHEICYFSGENLLGVSIIDLGKTWLNAVYFFFDPKSARRSPGTFNIINLINLCKTQGIQNLYLGYWLKESSAMRYKASFLPHHILIDGNWRKVT